MSFEIGGGQLTVNSDFNGAERKARAVFMADLLKAGPTMPGDLDPHIGEVVTKELAPDVTPQVVEQLAKTSDFIVRHS
jgi:hypothetical protein